MVLLALSWFTVAHAGTDGALPIGRHVDQVVLRNTRGDVRLTVDPEAKRPEVVALEAYPGPACFVDAVTNGRRVEIGAGHRRFERPEGCWTDFEVRLPPGAWLQIELGTGTIDAPTVAGPLRVKLDEGLVRVGGGDGDVWLEVGLGEVTLGRVTGEVQAHVDQGSITGNPAGLVATSVGMGRIQLRDLEGGLDADSAIGNIQASWAVPPSGPVLANVGDGNIVIDLPDGTPVRADMVTGSGTKTCHLPAGDGPEVWAIASIGSIVVR